ncbi:gamma-glutamyl phosphate reductase [Rhizodiscina lignyota]|uniref:glutamate-5-semialdehyde dehydrogenase n=1 Tax=Rhizodiscina lignyota TaxID=1504668 RepID=A0A9P4IHV0_9PEZI|nr:gamma-glutamyl phosphate reductase [Rhizodiscina lignyota]
MSLNNASAEEAATAAQLASRRLAVLSEEERNEGLIAIHDALASHMSDILAANKQDMAVANEAAQAGTLSQSLVKRLDLSRPGKYEDMLQGIMQVKDLPDPLGIVASRTLLDDGLQLERRSCPIGVLLIIFEARPEVIANIASLAIKSGNAAILKGGKESTESFRAIAKVIAKALESTAVPNDAIQLVTSRAEVQPLLQLDRYVDLVIPRGGNELVRSIKASTQIPVLGHADGLCTTYLRNDCDPALATRVIIDAKCSYAAACNALETLLVDEEAVKQILPAVAKALLERDVTLLCDDFSKASIVAELGSNPLIQDVADKDYSTEFLDLKLAIKTIPASDPEKALDFAITHINKYSSHHTDAILTADEKAAQYFMDGVDSAGVYWNASTRFADGQRYGFGTEVGISTNKIHARGPVGLEGLTIYKWLIRGDGQISGEYGEGKAKHFKHQKLPLAPVDDERVARTEDELEVLRQFRLQKPKHTNGVNGY